MGRRRDLSVFRIRESATALAAAARSASTPVTIVGTASGSYVGAGGSLSTRSGASGRSLGRGLSSLFARDLLGCGCRSILRGTHGRAAFPIPIPVAATRLPFVARHAIDIFVFFEEVRYVEERIALQTQVDECRLHAW